MAESIDKILTHIDKLTKVQQVDRELAARAANLCNTQQDVIRIFWAALKTSQSLVAYAQEHLCLVGEDDVVRDIAQDWASLIDSVYVAIVPPEQLN